MYKKEKTKEKGEERRVGMIIAGYVHTTPKLCLTKMVP